MVLVLEREFTQLVHAYLGASIEFQDEPSMYRQAQKYSHANAIMQQRRTIHSAAWDMNTCI